VWIKLKSYSEHRTALEEETADSKVRQQFLSPHAFVYGIHGKKGEEKKTLKHDMKLKDDMKTIWNSVT
jgi:hypothetical protein